MSDPDIWLQIHFTWPNDVDALQNKWRNKHCKKNACGVEQNEYPHKRLFLWWRITIFRYFFWYNLSAVKNRRNSKQMRESNEPTFHKCNSVPVVHQKRIRSQQQKKNRSLLFANDSSPLTMESGFTTWYKERNGRELYTITQSPFYLFFSHIVYSGQR